MRAVVLAGGIGSRLYPYTTVLPKPLMPVGNVPILDVVLKQLANSGFKSVTLAVGYLSDLIKAYVGSGAKYGLKIDYSFEKKPLGTIGPLSLIKGLKNTFLVINGDLLTLIDYAKMLECHKKSGSLATLASKPRRVIVDYGVLDYDKKGKLISHKEKPVLQYNVGMGICFFEPEVLKYIPKGRRFDFPDLVRSFLKKNIPLNIYKSEDYWRDIGRWEDYQSAQKDFSKIKRHLFKARKKVTL